MCVCKCGSKRNGWEKITVQEEAECEAWLGETGVSDNSQTIVFGGTDGFQ